MRTKAGDFCLKLQTTFNLNLSIQKTASLLMLIFIVW